MTERERFEAEVKKLGLWLLNRNSDGSYQEIEVQGFWQLWQAALAASAPKVQMSKVDTLAQWEITRDRGGYSSMMFVSDDAILAFTMDILARSAPNAELVAALKLTLPLAEQTAKSFGCDPATDPDFIKARAALAAAGA